MPIKVVIIGSNGLLGQSLVNRLKKLKTFKVYAMAAGENRNGPNLNYFEIDITNTKDLKQQLHLIAPDFVVNAIAMTNVDACEVTQKECDLINTAFTENLAHICHEIESHFIHISTDFIFDGIKGFYSEDDAPNPVNYYGLSKLNAEKAILNIGGDSTILRTILVYGSVKKMKRSNIVLWVKKSLENNESINIVKNQYRTPTYVGSIVDAIILVLDKKTKGIYHISGNEFLSIYEMALQIADFYDLDKKLIKAIYSSELNQKAKRPPKTGFILDKAIKDLDFKPLSLKEGLKRMTKTMTIDF